MAYIRIDKDLINDPRLIALAEQVAERFQLVQVIGKSQFVDAMDELSPRDNRRFVCNALQGALVTLWAYADTHLGADDTLQIGLSALSDVVGLPVEILELFPSDWLQIDPKGRVVLPGYTDKNLLETKEKRREKTRERVQNWRKNKAGNVTPLCNADVTPSCNADVTHVTGAIPIPRPNPIPKEKTSMSGKPDASPPKAEKKNGKNHEKPDALEVLAFLNEKTGRRYQAVDVNLKLIAARLREGATVADCRKVIAKKCREWSSDPKMAEYLRPATLFNATKFAQYIGELGAPDGGQP